MFGSDDITWCASDCSFDGCFRNTVNMKNRAGLHSYADFKGTKSCILNDVEVNTQERGWAGHFIASAGCRFRRNTLIICEDIKWVVSTVGNNRYQIDIPDLNIKAGDMMKIGANRWYETMAFESLYDEYDDANIQKQIDFTSNWGLFGKTFDEVTKRYGDLDIAANKMHDAVVEELKIKIKEAYINAKTSNNL